MAGQWDFFREEVKRQKTTQEWVARRAGISLNTLQGKITKDREPYLSEALALAKVLQLPVERLFPVFDKDYETVAEAVSIYGVENWASAHRSLVSDLMTLPPDKLADQEEAIHAIAEKVRRKSGEGSVSG